MTLVMVHAQDHLMTSILAKELITELVDALQTECRQTVTTDCASFGTRCYSRRSTFFVSNHQHKPKPPMGGFKQIKRELNYWIGAYC